MNWNEVLREPSHGDHIVQTYQDPAFLAEAVAEYLGTGLRRGEAAIIIARPQHSEAFLAKLAGAGEPGQLVVLDAEQTLARFMVDGMPQWNAFREVIGGLIAQVRLQYPAVRAYGEMVDILWQQGKRDAAIRLEEYWNELTRLQTFSLFCAYAMDALDPKAYAGLESVCKAHTHFIPTRDARAAEPGGERGEPQGARRAARQHPAVARGEPPDHDPDAVGSGDAALAVPEHAAHRRQGTARS